MSEKQPLYQLRNVKCSYTKSNDDVVLEIDELEIPEGELTVILGESGSGKTTLLEALALMNDTLTDDSELLFRPEKDKCIDIKELWNENSMSIANIRKWHFSFIFQDTNLMPNFNVSENIALTQLIQGNKIKSDEKRTISNLLQEIHLGKIGPDKSPFALSGGEKQRIAFVQAVYPQYSVLFGDEPTGSLDEENSKNIMNCLRNEVDTKNKTVIIVSHNIDLSLKYADRIIVLEKKATDSHSCIKPGNIFLSKDAVCNKKWFNSNDENNPLTDVKQEIKNILKPEKEGMEQSTITDKYDHLNASKFELFLKKKFNIKDFSILFFKREFRSLFNLKGLSIWLCLFITLLSIGIIGYINGRLAELEKEQKNPLMMRIVLPVSSKSSSSLIETIETNIRTEDAKNKKGKNQKDFGLKNVSGQNPIYLPVKDFHFKDSLDDDRRYARGLTMNVAKDSLLIHYLIFGDSTKKNSKASMMEENTIGIIVTRMFLKEFNYPESCLYLFVKSHNKSLPYITIPIVAVVNNLPNDLDFLCTEYFEHNYISGSKLKNSFTPPVTDKQLLIFLNKPNEKQDKTNETLVSYFQKQAVDIDTIYYFPYRTGLKIDIRLKNSASIYSLYNNIVQQNNWFEGNTTSFLLFNYDLETPKKEHKNQYNYMVLNFNNFNKIEDFNSWFQKNCTDNDMDYSVISEKSVFQKICDIADRAILIIILLAAITVTVLFVNLLTNHLDKISRNIGSYLAFGLKPNTLYCVYMGVIGIFIGLILILSIFLNNIMAIFINMCLNHVTMYLTIGIIVFSSLVCSYFTLRKYLTKTPGNLIYNRPKIRK